MAMQVTDEMVKHAVEAYRKDTGAEDWQLLGWIEPAIRAALEAVLSAEATSFRCEGCGSSWDDARLAEERAKRPELISCCPERKLEPVWYQNIKGMLRGVSFTEEMKMACLREFEAFYKSTLSAQVQDVAGWQPIETAPKDGSDVLLSSPNWHGDVVVGCWSFEGWRDREDSDKLEPTHWMPLPAAPAKQEG
ncbi:DUF551 domain-containing protein [Agrobacterium sp. CCNWLW32]|uniref:DUF551 domain-containing protein n=1 Tax=Agrobacterium sp. CCNWLW32 TaxID=3122072 RepID=UPI00300F8231